MAEAILLPQFPKEIDLSSYALKSHTHSGFASSSHSHSGYASSSHSHTLASLGIDESKMTINKTETYNINGNAWVKASAPPPVQSGRYLIAAGGQPVGDSVDLYWPDSGNRGWRCGIDSAYLTACVAYCLI